MKVLLTFTGMRDPYRPGPVDGQQQPGPIISLAKAQRFDRIVLFSTPKLKETTEATKRTLESDKLCANVEARSFPIDDPTNYLAILKGLRAHLKEIRKKGDKDEFFISIASGTPQMHACWLMLAASGEIPAHVLHVRPPEFVSKDKPVVYEVDLTSPEFPVIRSNFWMDEIKSEKPADVRAVAKDLGIIGDHESMRMTLEQSAALAQANVPVLILGETGTGKDLIAKFIHRLSKRDKGPFVPVNCAALPEALVESILFGHKKGAFTGAVEHQSGEFEHADEGTLFLDEVAELSLPTQAKLLRILQDHMLKRVGEKEPRKVDVRIVAATNRNLEKAVAEGKFREDLYFRLNVGGLFYPHFETAAPTSLGSL